MKKVIFSLTLFCILAVNAHATVRTVSNDPKAPAQYTSIQTAINNSLDGDTIMVYGSATVYPDITVDREIVMIGAGYRNPYGSNSTINNVYLDGKNLVGFTASDSKISGFRITNIYFYGHTNSSKIMEGVLIERCWVNYVDFNQATVTYRNDTVRNCFVTGSGLYVSNGTIENIQFHNNILDNSRIGDASYYLPISHDSVYVRNCVFLNRSGNSIFSYASDFTIENCIFYAAEPQGCTNCAFNNNITYLNTNNDLVGSPGNPGSVGSGNVVNENPLFVSYPLIGGAYSFSYDLNVENTNAVDGGTDATDMGIHGGMLPYTPGANPSIPQMTEISFPSDASSVKAGGTLEVTFKAKKQD